MLTSLKSPHFKRVSEFINHYEKDPGIDNSILKNRGSAFEILRDLSPALQNPCLVSSVYGKIDQVLLTLPRYVFDHEHYLKAYTSIVLSLPDDTQFIILTHEDIEEVCQNWINFNGIAGRSKLGFAPSYRDFTIWAEDAYCMAQDFDSGETFFIESSSFHRRDDAHIADDVSSFTNLKLSLADLYFEGGNVLVGDDYWLIGLDYPNSSLKLGYIIPREGESKLDAIRRAHRDNMDKHRTLYPIGTHLSPPEEQEFTFKIEGEEWGEKVFRGNRKGTSQPLFHIDMFITPLGKDAQGQNLVMVGDPSMANDILGDLDFVEESKRFQMNEAFKNIAERLIQMGFSVIRNPLPMAYYTDYATRTLEWYFATSNNALVQVTQESKDIWIPQYGYGSFPELKATDDETRSILESQGFNVHGLGDFHSLAHLLGAAHCITKYLKRS